LFLRSDRISKGAFALNFFATQHKAVMMHKSGAKIDYNSGFTKQKDIKYALFGQ